jgi:hypothetical protein
VKLALAIVLAIAIALVVAIRIPRSAEMLEDVPGIGWLVDLIGAAHEDSGPLEFRYRLDHPERLANVFVPGSKRQGDTLIVYDRPLTLGRPKLFAYSVVYQSDELTALSRALRKDDQAKKLGITVELDHIGYHLQIPSDGMYVNPDWAEAHHCDTSHRIVGTGVYCVVRPAERLSAYVKGDPGLFTDAHPLDVPQGRTFLPADAATSDRFYEVALPALALEPTRAVAGADSLDLTVDLPAFPSDAELVLQIGGTLYPATPHAGGLTVDCGGGLAADLERSYALAAAGLHELR